MTWFSHVVSGRPCGLFQYVDERRPSLAPHVVDRMALAGMAYKQYGQKARYTVNKLLPEETQPEWMQPKRQRLILVALKCHG